MVISESILINAPLKQVWDTFTDLTCWRDWSSVLSNVSFENERLTEGKSFKFCIRPFSFPMNIEPVVEELVTGQRLVWSGTKHGITARHEFIFEEKNGKTLLTSREIFKLNWLKRIFFHVPKKRLHKLSVIMLRDLKHACENNSIPENTSEDGLWKRRSN
ncbi:MAG: SRPBCC domain-containing protein [Nitrospirae bacterium]|nr:SRPBCC domain-containing protein [Nitrospirota bacterium]